MSRVVLRSALVVAAGGLLAVAIASLSGFPAADTLATIAIAAGSALVAALIGAFVMRRIRNRSARVQAVVVATVSLAVLAVGIVAAALTMFISSHDLGVLLAVVAVSGAIATGAALQLGEELDEGHRSLVPLTEDLAAGRPVDPAAVTGPEEVRAIAWRLADVSERLRESRRREQALETSRRELITWVSHDLRSPLATIRAMAEALDDGVVSDPATVARYHAQVRSDSERLTTLVDDLFELSRINSGTLDLDRRPVCLTEVVADALGAARAHADLKGVTVIDAVDDLPRMAVGSREVTRVLHNLLDNAIRHTPPGGRVEVVGTLDVDEVVIVVRDQCGGIPETDLDRVFDVAFRSDAARSRDARGGGLGLAIAKGLVEAHAGTIGVDNVDGGCCFSVQLPLGS